MDTFYYILTRAMKAGMDMDDDLTELGRGAIVIEERAPSYVAPLRAAFVDTRNLAGHALGRPLQTIYQRS